MGALRLPRARRRPRLRLLRGRRRSPLRELPEAVGEALRELPEAVGGGSIELSDRVAMGALQFAGDVSLAALIGGNLFGRLAMGPALRRISDKGERGKVLNSAWRRYGTVNSLAAAGLVASWVPNRRRELDALWVERGERALIALKDVVTGAVLVSGLAAAAGGVGFAHEAPEGAVPMESGSQPAPEASPRATRLKRALNMLASANLAFELGLVAVNVALLQRRTRRLLRR